MQVIPVLILIGVGALLFFLEKRAKPVKVPDLPDNILDEDYIHNVIEASRKGNATIEMIDNALNLVKTRYPWNKAVIEELEYIKEVMEKYPQKYE